MEARAAKELTASAVQEAGFPSDFSMVFQKAANTAFGLRFDRTVKAVVDLSGDHSTFLKVHLPQTNA
jgi:hypothetical protein